MLRRPASLLARRSHCFVLVLATAFIPFLSQRFFSSTTPFGMSTLADPTSLSNPLDVQVLSSHLALRVDFSKKILAGYVDHNTKVVKEGASTLVLDSKALAINKVSIVRDSEEPAEVQNIIG